MPCCRSGVLHPCVVFSTLGFIDRNLCRKCHSAPFRLFGHHVHQRVPSPWNMSARLPWRNGTVSPSSVSTDLYRPLLTATVIPVSFSMNVSVFFAASCWFHVSALFGGEIQNHTCISERRVHLDSVFIVKVRNGPCQLESSIFHCPQRTGAAKTPMSKDFFMPLPGSCNLTDCWLWYNITAQRSVTNKEGGDVFFWSL